MSERGRVSMGALRKVLIQVKGVQEGWRSGETNDLANQGGWADLAPSGVRGGTQWSRSTVPRVSSGVDRRERKHGDCRRLTTAITRSRREPCHVKTPDFAARAHCLVM